MSYQPPRAYECEICGGPGGKRGLVRDHEHGHGCGTDMCRTCFRGWLCNNCNSALGMLHDDIVRLKAAIAYLERHAARRGGTWCAECGARMAWPRGSLYCPDCTCALSNCRNPAVTDGGLCEAHATPCAA